MLEVLNADFLRTARAKGVPERRVIRKHALGNAWIPILTTIANTLSIQLAGSVVIEQVFSWPGVGRMTVEAVAARDVTTTTGCVILTTIIYVILLLVVDLLYALVDPRIKSQYISAGKRKARIPSVRRSLEPVMAVATVAQINVPELLHEEALDVPSEEDGTVGIAQHNAVSDIQAVLADTGMAGQTPESKKEQDFAFVENKPKDGVDIYENVSWNYKRRSQMGEIVHRLKQSKSAMIGFALIGLIFVALIGSIFIPFEAVIEPNMQNRFSPPSWQHPFGTDNFGRDMFLRTIYGTRYSIAIALGGAAIASIIGIFLGSLAGYYGKVMDEIIMRISDIIAAIPGLLIGMVILVVLGQSLQNLVIAVGVNAIPVFIRISRASVIQVRTQEFIEAAKAVGISDFRIIFTQVLPNGLSPIIVTFTLTLGMVVILASSLSFLGFGVPVPTPEWGSLIAWAREFARPAPFLMVFPGLFIMITVLGFNLLGDGLRDALDPKLRK
jgi:peptide/nickel transport system permease protein